jgi:hypothetical protein
MVYLGLGERQKGLKALLQADSAGGLPNVTAPFWEPIRNEPAFQAILRRRGINP